MRCNGQGARQAAPTTHTTHRRFAASCSYASSRLAQALLCVRAQVKQPFLMGIMTEWQAGMLRQYGNVRTHRQYAHAPTPHACTAAARLPPAGSQRGSAA